MPILSQFLERLCQVERLCFVATSAPGSARGWNGAGRGRVEARDRSAEGVTLVEAGTYRPWDGRATPFRNVFRFTRRGGALLLEHLRRGPEFPVFLLELVPARDRSLVARAPHLCGSDRYWAILRLAGEAVRIDWRIAGPRKDQRIRYAYGPGSG